MKNRISLLILLAISFSIHAQKVMRIGIIGLDTSHSTAFTELINSGSDETFSKGFRVVAAYPYGSKTIQSSYERIPGYIEKVKANGVEITSSIADLLEKVDCVLLETNDGRLHLEQAVEVFKSGRRRSGRDAGKDYLCQSSHDRKCKSYSNSEYGCGRSDPFILSMLYPV